MFWQLSKQHIKIFLIVDIYYICLPSQLSFMLPHSFLEGTAYPSISYLHMTYKFKSNSYLSGVISLTGNKIQVKVELLKDKGFELIRRWPSGGAQRGQSLGGPVVFCQQSATMAALPLLDCGLLWGKSNHYTARWQWFCLTKRACLVKF